MQQSLFCELKGKTQAERVLWHLERFGRITNLQCHDLYGIRHCPSVIRDLRKKFLKQGSEYAIINEKKKGCNKFGDPVTWDDYVLVKTNSQSPSV